MRSVLQCHVVQPSKHDFRIILLREALLTLEGGVKLVFPCVRASVRADNNCFLRRVYEPTTHAGTHWQFEIMILKVFKKNISKSQVKT